MFSYRYNVGHVARMVVVVLAVLSAPLFAEPSMHAAQITDPDVVTQTQVDEIENRLRRELLDDRARMHDRWLASITIILASFAVIIPILGFIAGYFGFKNFQTEARRHVDSSKEHADEALRLVEQIKGKHAEAEADAKALKDLRKINAEDISNDPKKAEQVEKSVQENPEASPVDKAIAAAGTLQQQGKIDGAIEKWRSIANIMEGTDMELAARAWLSVGYLYGQEKRDSQAAINAYTKVISLKPDDAKAYYNRGLAKGKLNRHEEAIADCDKAIELKPDYAEAYNNRGLAKNSLGRYEEAIADYGEAILREPGDVKAYNNRGVTKENLGRYKEAIADFDQAIELVPDFALAYANRGLANKAWGRMDEARKGFEKALSLAVKAGDKDLATWIRKKLEDLDKG